MWLLASWSTQGSNFFSLHPLGAGAPERASVTPEDVLKQARVGAPPSAGPAGKHRRLCAADAFTATGKRNTFKLKKQKTNSIPAVRATGVASNRACSANTMLLPKARGLKVKSESCGARRCVTGFSGGGRRVAAW